MEPKDRVEMTEDSDIDHINNVVSDNSDVIQETAVDTQEVQKKVEPIKKAEPIKKVEPKKVQQKIEPKKVEPVKKIDKVPPKRIIKVRKFVPKKTVAKVEQKITRKKMVIKKTASREKKKSYTWLWILIAILVIAGIALLIITLSKDKPVDKTTTEIAATVNGEAIYLKDVDEQYNSMNPLMQQIYTKEAVLNQTIDELLLIQQAKNMNIIVREDEVDSELELFKTQNGLSDSDFADLIEKQNLTLDDLNKLIERRLMIKNFINETILSKIEVTDSAINDYYDQNTEKFKTPEQVTAQHILIMITENVTDAQALKEIQDIQKELTSNNFCELAKKYSQDPGSKDTCGTYTFGKGEMVKEFEDASFELDINETQTVKTTYGYHLIKKLRHEDSTTLKLEEVKDEIKTFLHDEKAQQDFDALLVQLREKAVIVNYMNKESNVATEENTAVPKNLDDFAKCITEKGAKFYGAYWCPHCNNQKEMFGDSMQYIEYIECAVEGQPQVQTDDCTLAGITGYPTWIINGESYPGEQTLANLARLTGCTV
ncbi:MAG: peptidylprolyl isomerase [Candidatus Woesearchaeota archaeon]